MRQASVDDIGILDELARRAGLPPLPAETLDTCIVCLGEHGFILLDPITDAMGIIHVTVAPTGRGKWAKEFFGDCIEWLFTHTRVETIVSQIPRNHKHVTRFAVEAGFRVMCKTKEFSYVILDIATWALGDKSLALFSEYQPDDYVFADIEAIRGVSGACKLMKQADMPGKAWYIHNLYAKLFGYKAEV
jgi:hypothetical protein